jgi:hypothetical protein
LVETFLRQETERESTLGGFMELSCRIVDIRSFYADCKFCIGTFISAGYADLSYCSSQYEKGCIWGVVVGRLLAVICDGFL